MTYPSKRLIEVDQDLEPAAVEWVLHHELGHAYSIDNLNPLQRTYFAKLMDKTDFFDQSDYWRMPAETWANTQAKCAGLTPLDNRLTLSCDTLTQTEAYTGA